MNKIISTLTLSAIAYLPFSASAAATFIYQSPDHSISMTVKQTEKLIYVSKVNIRQNGCNITELAGKEKGKVNTSVSLNFAIFGWYTSEGKNINGIISNSQVVSYAKTMINWPDITSGNCHIKAGKAELPIVSER